MVPLPSTTKTWRKDDAIGSGAWQRAAVLASIALHISRVELERRMSNICMGPSDAGGHDKSSIGSSRRWASSNEDPTCWKVSKHAFQELRDSQ